MNKQVAVAERPKAALSSMMAGGSALLPIYPKTFDEVVRLARMSIISGMIKPLEFGYGDQKRTEEPQATEARGTMIIMQGMEVGLPPMQAIQLIAMINGRMVIHSEGVPGLLLSKGFKIKPDFVGQQYDDAFKAVCTLTRPDGQVFVGAFSVADAKEADLWETSPTITKFGKTKPNDSPWFRYRKRMLWARALGFAAKDGGADAMRGLMVREEVEDMIRKGEVIDITPTAPPSLRRPEHHVDDGGVPDIPDKSPTDDASDITDPVVEHEPLAEGQQELFLEQLKEDVLLCMDDGERATLAEDNAGMLERLSDANRRRAEAILDGRG